jgi:predicted hydrolase (HD superfamily)
MGEPHGLAPLFSGFFSDMGSFLNNWGWARQTIPLTGKENFYTLNPVHFLSVRTAISTSRRIFVMGEKVPTREEALKLLHQYFETDSLRKHAYAVEGVMRFIARKRGEDVEKWGIVGLIHDLDYEKFPDQHCGKTREILEKEGWAEEYIRAAVSHGWGICSEVEPQTVLEKTLYAIDELTGLVVTTALIRPSKSVMDVAVKSVKNKWKDKRFAAGVDRSIIEKGAAMLGVSLEQLIEDTIKGMQEVAEAIGLKGAS